MQDTDIADGDVLSFSKIMLQAVKHVNNNDMICNAIGKRNSGTTESAEEKKPRRAIISHASQRTRYVGARGEDI